MTSDTRDLETPARSATLTIVGRRGVTFPKAVRATDGGPKEPSRETGRRAKHVRTSRSCPPPLEPRCRAKARRNHYPRRSFESLLRREKCLQIGSICVSSNVCGPVWRTGARRRPLANSDVRVGRPRSERPRRTPGRARRGGEGSGGVQGLTIARRPRARARPRGSARRQRRTARRWRRARHRGSRPHGGPVHAQP